LSTISAAVTSGGRVFYIVDQAPQAFISFETEWKLVARDAFNGVLLWERSIPKWNDHMRHFRSGPVHLQRRLVAAADKVYVTLGLDAPLSQLDAATGQTLRTYEDTEWCEEVITDNGFLYVLVGSSETKRRGPGLYAENEPAMREDRYMAAIDASTGKEIWRMNAKGAEYILPHGMALSNGRLYYHSVKGLGRLDAKTGKKLWLIERETLAARYGYSTSKLVATPEVILLADSNLKKDGSKAVDDIQWGVGAWSAPATRGGPSTVTAYSVSDGKRLWSANCHGGYNTPVDVFVVDGVVWLGPYNTKETSKDGYDLKTGKVVKTISIKGDKVGMVHDRCYLNKASNNFVFGCRDGVELHDFEKGWVRNNSWTRGPCQLGVMPANGLLYAPTDPCACHLKTRLPGFKAYSSNKLNSVGKPLSTEGRLARGPAYGKLKALPAQKTSAMDWPIHRRDIARSGSTLSSISTPVRTRWTKEVGGKLTQPVIADGRVFVASPDRQTIYAFDEATGESLWTFLVGGVIDSSPSLHQGRVLFGAADGKVYCLDAQTGALAWAFLAAPQEWLICAFGRLTSAWPVHGSLITVGNEVCFTAGKSSYLSGGLHFYRLDIPTGKVMAHHIYTTIETDDRQSDQWVNEERADTE
jgi:outer membrane protein assembly factor BamB